MRRKSATPIVTKSGEFIEYHLRLRKNQYEELWDVADDKNVDISEIIRESIDYILGKYAKKNNKEN